MKCVPCKKGETALSDHKIADLLVRIPEWSLVEKEGIKRLARVFRFNDFAEALAFTNEVGNLAEAEGHHPLITTGWGRVKVEWWTHKINGLHQNDFIMAAKTNDLYSKSQSERE
jgi:4a-hydroxytetrahydrobiopterin dehydratase